MREFVHVYMQQWPAESLVWTSDPTLFFKVLRPGYINNKKMIKKEKISSVSFNSNFCEFIHWRQSQEYRTFWVT
jgi:hypothetical protein